jgi:hypothetical protein
MAIYAREQQGVSDGQWLSFVHFPAAVADAAKAAATRAAERAARTMSYVWV